MTFKKLITVHNFLKIYNQRQLRTSVGKDESSRSTVCPENYMVSLLAVGLALLLLCHDLSDSAV